MKTALIASALALAMTSAALAQTGTSPTVANPPSQGKTAPVTNDASKMGTSGSTGGAMTNPQQTPGGQQGPSGQQAKPK